MTHIILQALTMLLIDGHCPSAETYAAQPAWDFSQRTGDVAIGDCMLPTTAELPAAMIRLLAGGDPA